MRNTPLLFLLGLVTVVAIVFYVRKAQRESFLRRDGTIGGIGQQHPFWKFPLLRAIREDQEVHTCNVREGKNRLYLDGVPETSAIKCCDVPADMGKNKFEKVDNKDFELLHFYRQGTEANEIYDLVYGQDADIQKCYDTMTEQVQDAPRENEGTGYSNMRGSDINGLTCASICDNKNVTDYSIKDNLKTTTLTSASVDAYFNDHLRAVNHAESGRDALVDESPKDLMMINRYQNEAVINGGNFHTGPDTSITGFSSYETDYEKL